MFVKLPIHESTLLNSSGRSQATVKAQIPPLLAPAIARLAASWRSFTVFSTSGQDLLEEEACVLIRERVVFETAVGARRPRTLRAG